MYRGMGIARDDGRNRAQIGRSPPRRRRTPEDENKFCIYCKVQLSSPRLFEEHKNSAVHKQKEILIAKALSDGLQYCYTCEKIFPSKLALDAHCLMTRHKPLYRVDELQELLTKNTNPNNLIQVQRPPESRRAREEKERQDIVTKLNEVRGTDAVGDKNGRPNAEDNRNDKGSNESRNYFCDVCNVDCMNFSNFKIHSESWRHRSEVDKKRDEEKLKFDEEAEQQFNAAEELERKKVPAHLTAKAGFFCEVCSIASVSEAGYLDHLKNRKHFRQVGQMRRPYKCYFCEVEFNVAKDFNYHLESRTHMEKAFNTDKNKKREKEDEWVEKKTERREHRDKDRESRKDDRGRSRAWHHEKEEVRDRRSKDGKKDSRKAEMKETVSKHADARKVEIVDVDNPVDTGIKDLREKLKAQKNIIITKPNSPERTEDEKNEEGESADTQGNQAKLEEVEKEFAAKFDALMKKFEEDHAGLQEQLARDREEDINTYQKYEDDFKELKEEEDFIRGNIDKLDDDDPCKQDFIIDIIRVQRKMEEVRLQLEMKEVTIIKRENSYRKYFPDNEEEKEIVNAESENSHYVDDYDHGSADKEVEDVVQNVADTRVPPENNVSDISGTDLRVKLERERLLKRLGPELESVDPTLREKLLSVILEKDKDGDSLKTSIEAKIGDTRQVVKDANSLRELTKREKQLEIELANLKSVDKKKKKNIPKSLVPQYDDVDDKKKEIIKKKPRKRSVSSSSSSRSSSSSSDSSYCRNRRKRKGSPSKARLKSKRSRSLDKVKRKRRSISREREKRKRVPVKKGRDDERKKRVDHTKGEKKRIKSPDGGKKSKLHKSAVDDDNDSDVQVITPSTKIQPISVIGSTSTAHPTKMSTPIEVSTTMPYIQPTTSSNLPPRREQFSFWKNPVVVQPTQKESPKEDIWDSAFSGGQKEDTTGSATLKLFDPQGGTQLPEDILNILKSVAPIIQQTQHHSPYKQHSRVPVSTKPSVSTNSSYSYNNSNSSSISLREKIPVASTNEDKEDEINGPPRIRSILKKGIGKLPFQDVTHHEDFSTIDRSQPEIPGLDVSPNHSPHRSEHIPRSQSEVEGHHSEETSKHLYNDDSRYASTEENDRLDQTNDHDPVNHNYTYTPRPSTDSNGKSYEHTDQYDKRDIDEKDQDIPNYESAMDYRRKIVPPGTEDRNVYNDVDMYRQPPERNASDRVLSPQLGRRSPNVGSSGRPAENLGTYDAERSRPDMDPYLRSEVTHRVIDYSYVRDTRVIPGDSRPPPARYNDDNLKQPVRYPGETDDEYYARFERFYEMNRRNEEHHTGRDRDIPSRRIVEGGRMNPDGGRVPPRDDYFAPKDRYDDRVPRPPQTDPFTRPRGVPDHDRIPPMSGRVIDESVRRIEHIPFKDDGRDSSTHVPYQQVVEITKRVEDKSVREGSSERPYRWSETVESRFTTDTVRNTRNDFPGRDTSRDIDSRGTRGTLPRLPPPHNPPPRISGLPRARLPRPTAVPGDYENKYQDY